MMDRYEIEAIAKNEAHHMADELRRDLEYGQLTDLRRELEAVQRDIYELREGLRTLDAMRLEK